jgi:hypothetical protein
MFSGEDGMAYCVACEMGEYQNMKGQSKCLKCGDGEGLVFFFKKTIVYVIYCVKNIFFF